MTTPFTSLGYYKVSPDLAGHPKLEELAEELGVDPWTALGMWHGVLSWTAKYAPSTGIISRYPPRRIAKACGWEGDPQYLLKVLVKVGFCDEVDMSVTDSVTDSDTEVGTDIVIHDWWDWHGDVAESREVSEAKSEGARKGNHIRFHQGKRKKKAGCDYCFGIRSVTDSVSESDTDIDRVEESKVEESRGWSSPPNQETKEEPYI